MARELKTIYAGKVIIDGPNPSGTFQNESDPGVSDDGTPNDEQWAQDHEGFLAHMLNQAGISHNGVQENEDNSQYYDALKFAIENIALNPSLAATADAAIVAAAATAAVAASVEDTYAANLASNIVRLTRQSNDRIDFSEGIMVFDDGTGSAAAPNYNKYLGSPWVSGNFTNGLDTGGVENSTWYFCYAIYNPTTQASDYLFTKTFGSPTLAGPLSGYTKKEYLGAIFNGIGVTIDSFVQLDNRFYWSLMANSAAVNNPGTAVITQTLVVPKGIAVDALVSATLYKDTGTSTPVYCIIYPFFQADPTPDIILNNLAADNSNSEIANLTGVFPTNSLGQIKYRLSYSDAGTTIMINVAGWIDKNIRT